MNPTIQNPQSLAFAYVRVSTDRQDLSVEAQTTTCQRAADYQELPLADEHIFAEPNVSGSKPFLERTEALRMVQTAQAHIAAGYAVTLLCPKVDRLGRDTVDVSNTAKLLEELGIRLVLLDINVDTRSPMGRAFMQIAAVFAELELSRIRERTQIVLDQKREQGYCTGTVPFGWDAIETGEVSAKGTKLRRMVDNLKEQDVLNRIHVMRECHFSHHRISKTLNAEGIPTKTGSTWHPGTIRKLLATRTVREWYNQQLEAAA